MAHEAHHRDEAIEGSSDRSFGLVFAAVFSIVALWPLVSSGAVRWWAAGVAATFALLAFVAPRVLAPLNRAWMKLGLWMGRVVSPIVLGILFFVVFWPMGLLMRAAGKDPLRLKKPSNVSTYWVERKPPGPKPESLHNQF